LTITCFSSDIESFAVAPQCKDNEAVMELIGSVSSLPIGCDSILSPEWLALSTSPCHLKLSEIDDSLALYGMYIGEICPVTCGWGECAESSSTGYQSAVADVAALSEELETCVAGTCGDNQEEIIQLKQDLDTLQNEVTELQTEVERLQQIENINAGCQDLANMMEASAMDPWKAAVEDGGLSCSFVPQAACIEILACSWVGTECITLP